MATVFVKPAEGARIRQPEQGSRIMPAAGVRVPRDAYYERLILTGNLVETDGPKENVKEDPPAPPPPPDSDNRRR